MRGNNSCFPFHSVPSGSLSSKAGMGTMLFSLRPALCPAPRMGREEKTMSPCPLGNTCSKLCVHSRAGWSAPAGQVRAHEAKGHGSKGGENPAPHPRSPHTPPPFPSADGELAKFLPWEHWTPGLSLQLLLRAQCHQWTEVWGQPSSRLLCPLKKNKNSRDFRSRAYAWSRATAYLGRGMKPWGKVLTAWMPRAAGDQSCDLLEFAGPSSFHGGS